MILTKEEIIGICSKLNFTYIDHGNESTINGNGRKQVYVRFICNAHQKYGIQEKSLYDLKRLKKPCQYCSHKMLKITFKEEMAEINPDIEILSDYVNWDTKIRCKCKIDNIEWDANVSTLLNGCGCKMCGYRKQWDSRGRKTTDNFIKEMELVDSNIEIIGEYSGSHKLIKCRCKIDGKEWESYACNLLNKSAGCPECASKRAREIESLSQQEVRDRIHDLYPHIDVVGEYINRGTPIECRCNIHDITFIANPRTLLYNKGTGCPKCKQSLGEKKMQEILFTMGYDIDPQHVFPDCKYINCLRFDGYSEVHNIAFEYQGQQHYYPVDFSGKNDGTAEKEYELNVIRDNIKRDYCQKNNIKLIEIPYWEYDNMESFLRRKLN